MEQAIPMLGKTIAVDKNDMTCEGLSLNELAAIDWSAIDLSEWIGLMGEAGVLPQTEEDTSLENMTGSGQLLNSAGRDNTVDRMRARQSDGSMTDTQRQIWDQIKLNEIDCTSPSRPAVCSYLGGP
jgi:conjugal transfer mating pair stabilization protein TraN